MQMPILFRYNVEMNILSLSLTLSLFLSLSLQVILALIMLFITSWGTSIISVNYFNYNRGSSTEFLLVIARFANITFIALSPIVLAFGHRRLRAVIKALVSH